MLIIKHANENWKLYIISLIVLTIPIYLTNTSYALQRNLPVFEDYVLLMIPVGGLYSGMFFKKWTDKVKGSNYLMLPATVTEKIALVFFYTIVVFIPLYTGLFYLESLILHKIYNPDAEMLFIGQTVQYSPIYTFLTEAIVLYVFLQSLFLLFQIWFRKRQTVKILIYLYCSFFFVTLCNTYYLKWISGSQHIFIDKKFVLFPVTVSYSGYMDLDLFTSPLIAGISVPVIILITILIYIAAYYKLKEKEI
jgi:hypothetical protein